MCAGDDHNCPQFELHRQKLLDELDSERRSFDHGEPADLWLPRSRFFLWRAKRILAIFNLQQYLTSNIINVELWFAMSGRQIGARGPRRSPVYCSFPR